MEQWSLRAMMVAVSQQDPGLLRQDVLEVASARRGFDDDQLERSLARFMATVERGDLTALCVEPSRYSLCRKDFA